MLLNNVSIILTIRKYSGKDCVIEHEFGGRNILYHENSNPIYAEKL